jgi:hypothetical protein
MDIISYNTIKDLSTENIFKSLLDIKYKLLKTLLSNIDIDYPNFNTWFDKSIIDIIRGNKSIIICKDFSGVAILKHTKIENKICTFRVEEKYQHKGVGTELMYTCLDILQDSKPIITVSDKRIIQFEKLLNKFNFDNDFCLYQPYKLGVNEYFFNSKINQKI